MLLVGMSAAHRLQAVPQHSPYKQALGFQQLQSQMHSCEFHVPLPRIFSKHTSYIQCFSQRLGLSANSCQTFSSDACKIFQIVGDSALCLYVVLVSTLANKCLLCRPRLWFWESIELLQTFALASGIALAASTNSYYQLSVGLTVLLVGFGLLSLLRPYCRAISQAAQVCKHVTSCSIHRSESTCSLFMAEQLSCRSLLQPIFTMLPCTSYSYCQFVHE